MTSLDQNTPLTPEQRDELIKLHDYDELIFGGFICLHCTPEDCDDPDDNVYYPCPPLRAAGVTNEEAVALIKARWAEIERRAAVERVKDLLAEVERLNKAVALLGSQLQGGDEAHKHLGRVIVDLVDTMREAVKSWLDTGDPSAAMAIVVDKVCETPETSKGFDGLRMAVEDGRHVLRMLLLDPDCRDGKCGSCVGGPCEHECHQVEPGGDT